MTPHLFCTKIFLMYFVYILKSLKNGEFYIGYTANPNERLKEHNSGLSKHTKKYLPWKYVYIEGYANKEDAQDREIKLKQFGRVYSQLKIRIRRSLL